MCPRAARGRGPSPGHRFCLPGCQKTVVGDNGCTKCCPGACRREAPAEQCELPCRPARCRMSCRPHRPRDLQRWPLSGRPRRSATHHRDDGSGRPGRRRCPPRGRRTPRACPSPRCPLPDVRLAPKSAPWCCWPRGTARSASGAARAAPPTGRHERSGATPAPRAPLPRVAVPLSTRGSARELGITVSDHGARYSAHVEEFGLRAA